MNVGLKQKAQIVFWAKSQKKKPGIFVVLLLLWPTEITNLLTLVNNKYSIVAKNYNVEVKSELYFCRRVAIPFNMEF